LFISVVVIASELAAKLIVYVFLPKLEPIYTALMLKIERAAIGCRIHFPETRSCNKTEINCSRNEETA